MAYANRLLHFLQQYCKIQGCVSPVSQRWGIVLTAEAAVLQYVSAAVKQRGTLEMDWGRKSAVLAFIQSGPPGRRILG